MSQSSAPPRDLSREDVETLINCVFLKPELWDTSSHAYKDQPAKKRAWEEIAHILKTDVATIKTRWTSLRTRYGKEKKKTAGKSGQATDLSTQWLFFSAMTFLEGALDSTQITTCQTPETQECYKGLGIQIVALHEADSEGSQGSGLSFLCIVSPSASSNPSPATSSVASPALSPVEYSAPSPARSPAQFSAPPSPQMNPPPSVPPTSTLAPATSQGQAEREFRPPAPKRIKKEKGPTNDDPMVAYMKERHAERDRRCNEEESDPTAMFFKLSGQRAKRLSFRNRSKLERLILDTIATMYEEENLDG